MPQITRIVFPTDYSALSSSAAGYAAMLAKAHGAEVWVIHIVQPVVINAAAPMGGMPIVDEINDADREQMSEFVERHFEGLMAHRELKQGFPPRDISAFAEKIKADLIVIGTHAEGPLWRIIHGSVSKAVMESSPCAVLMVPLKVAKAERGGRA